MNSKKMFKKIMKCPFCGNKKSIRVSKQKLIRNFYVKEIVTDLKISFSDDGIQRNWYIGIGIFVNDCVEKIFA